MGACCFRMSNESEKLVQDWLRCLNIRKLTYDQVRKLIIDEDNKLELTDDFKLKISERNLSVFNDTFQKISEKNFMEIVHQNFIVKGKDNEHLKKYQIRYFENIIKLSKSNKYFLLMNIFPLLKFNGDESFKDFIDLFKEINELKEIKYSDLKKHLLSYIQINLHQTTQATIEITTSKELKEELTQSLSTYEIENIINFLHKIFEEFERNKFLNFEDQFFFNNHNLTSEEITRLFRGREYLFDINDLRVEFSYFSNRANS